MDELTERSGPPTETAAEKSKRLLLEKSRQELVNKTKEAFKVFAPMSTFLGFVGDIIKPLAPILHYVAAFFIMTTIVLGIMLLVDRKRGTTRKLTQYLPHSVILAVVLMVFSAMGFGHKEGFFGTNFDVVHQFQVNVLNVEPAPTEKPATPEAAPFTDNSANTVNISLLDRRLDDIRERISLQQLVAEPAGVIDHLVNAGIYYNTGNLGKAEAMLEHVLKAGYVKLDLCYRYYEVLFANLDGDESAITRRLDSLGFSGNEMMKVAALDFMHKGVNYFRELEKAGIGDPLLRALSENKKARSLIADSHNYWLYQPYLVARWIPDWNSNDAALGRNIIKAKKYFFDYPAAYRQYLAGTTDEHREDLLWRTDIHHASNDPDVQREAMKLWKRVASGEMSRAGNPMTVRMEGIVTDESGSPLEDVVVTDFDTHTAGSIDYNMTVTDSAGQYVLTTGRNHLIRFEPMFNKKEFRDAFVVSGTATGAKVIIGRKP